LRHAIAVLILPLLGPAPAFALWGPFGGLSRLDVDEAGISRLEGYEAGIFALAEDRSSLWHLAYIKVKADPDTASLELYQVRMSLRLFRLDLMMPYIGTGAGLGWLSRNGSRRRLLTTEAHVGVLLSPADVGTGLWGALPCLSCLRNSSDPKCGECMSRKRRSSIPRTTRTQQKPSWLQVGVEAGYRSAKMSMSGFEGRLYGAVLF
jgi:hypothetical protein